MPAAAVADQEPKTEPVVICEQLSVRYGRNWALKDVTATFQPGAVGLLGPNGAGKSTTHQDAARVRQAGSGPHARARPGRRRSAARDSRPRRLHAGERRAHSRHERGVVRRLLRPAVGLPRADAMQRAHEVLYYVGLGEARYRNVETYSTGMKQRIKLAQALVHDPDLLFLDEPTNGMDPKGRDEMLELIRDLAHNKRVNLILSSHLLPDVEFTCDHVVVMDKGAIATAGPIDGAQGDARPRLRAARQGQSGRFHRGVEGRRARLPRHGRGHHPRLHAGRRRRTATLLARPPRGARTRPGTPPAPERADARGRLRPRCR